ncbi:hypothetical protein [Methanosarcina sp.]|uniref:hypothetical protein n=1 Tax=Methanosarcina sp. TaxID=2213 RepID=UPI003BB762CA
MKLQRVNKTITVDPIKITLFEDIKNIHNTNISDFIDKALEEFLSKFAPDEMQRQKIRDLEQELAEAQQTLPEIDFMMKQRKAQQASKQKEEPDNKNNKQILEKYELNKNSLAAQVNKKLIDWKTISDVYGFKNPQEAEDIIRDKLKEDGLLGCEACKKWNSKSQYCKTYNKTMNPNNSCRNWERT